MKNVKKVFFIGVVVFFIAVSGVFIGISVYQTKNPKFICGNYCFDRHKEAMYDFQKFNITFYEDGTYNYYEGAASSYIGSGTYTIVEDILIMDENESMGYDMYEYFRIDGDQLFFIEEKSSNFIYVYVKDGDTFTYTGES